MISVDDVRKMDFNSIPVDPFWNTGDEKELKMHRIHSYPAKFPAFITTKALQYANDSGLTPNWSADIFCGCGTVAFEAKRNNINFWGCDINPVATMIAKAKSRKYSFKLLHRYNDDILSAFFNSSNENYTEEDINTRLKYWYDKRQLEELSRLKHAIEEVVPSKSYYRLFFICGFSNILKSTSRWLTKSIKPQVDPNKKPLDVISAFQEQIRFMITANDESDVSDSSKTKILTANILKNPHKQKKVEMIITSPPYVTSYEYADLHQLSSLWLNFAEDYKERSGHE